MQTMVSSLDEVMGPEAAKPYTALALQTIPQHFRCLRDAIGCQIQVTRKSLEEQDNSDSKGAGISRLCYTDQRPRQQRALHCPNDSEKLMLAKQTGSTRSQVSNWLINARVRLWKPMIEDMYKEEIGDAEIDSSSSSEYFPKVQADIPSTGYQEHLQNASIERCQTNISNSTSVDFQDEASAEDNYTNRKMRTIREDSSFLQDSLARMDGFVAYQMSEFALGAVGCLCHCDYSTPMVSFLHLTISRAFLGFKGNPFTVQLLLPSMPAQPNECDSISSANEDAHQETTIKPKIMEILLETNIFVDH
ncbi:Homeobox domain containing protein [Musa troglodytarum]|nr:Homeobox domain containing protein [Musa troglodytarum]